MPKKGADSRKDYQDNKAYYLAREKTPEALKKRAVRQKDRREAVASGKLNSMSDAREVDHKTPLSKGGGGGKGNTRITTAKANRSKHNT